MEEKFVSIFHNNIKSNLRNSIFDVNKNNEIESPIFRSFVRLKDFLKKRNIYLNTYDIPTHSPPSRYIHIDLPYPLPSNFSIWITIFSNREKNILICTEPPIVNPFNYMRIFHFFFTKVYTTNDTMVDNKKYFKIRFPQSSVGIKTRAKKFKKKKFLTLINSNKSSFSPFKLLSPFSKELYTERIKSIEFFEQTLSKDFYLYGRGWNKKKKYNLSEIFFGYKKYISYKGGVSNKSALLSNFKYCLCFENLTNVDGYITEKIFDCFKSKCVPIYWGASNIEKYIPKECFIDFRDFRDYKRLLNYLHSIDEKRYNTFIKNIKKLLADKKFIETWFEDGFVHFFLEEVLEIKNKPPQAAQKLSSNKLQFNSYLV